LEQVEDISSREESAELINQHRIKEVILSSRRFIIIISVSLTISNTAGKNKTKRGKKRNKNHAERMTANNSRNERITRLNFSDHPTR
jgi:hypothetical protein